MLLEDLESYLEDFLPDGFVIKKDKQGQFVVHTGLKTGEDGELVPLYENDSYDDEEDDEEEYDLMDDENIDDE